MTFAVFIFGFIIGSRFVNLFPENVEIIGDFALLGIGIHMIL